MTTNGVTLMADTKDTAALGVRKRSPEEVDAAEHARALRMTRAEKQVAAAALVQTPEYRAAIELRNTFDVYASALANPATHPDRRRWLADLVVRVASHDWSKPEPDPTHARLVHFFGCFAASAVAFAAARIDTRDAGERDADPLVDLSAESVAADVAREMSVLFPRETLEMQLLARAIEEWVIDGATSDRSKRGGRRKGRMGKWNALAAAIAGTSFAMTAHSLEDAHRTWSRECARRSKVRRTAREKKG